MALVLGPVGAAGAATPSPEPTGPREGTYIVFSGAATRVDTDDDGVQRPKDPQEVTITISCTADGECESSGWPWSYDGERLPYDGSSGSWTLPQSGDWCDSQTNHRVRTMTIASVSATTLVGSEELPGSGWIDCSGTQTYVFGIRFDFTLDYVEGEPCVLDALICPPIEAPGPTAAGGRDATTAATRTVSSPSVLSRLAVPEQTLSLQQCALAAVLAVILALLMGFPTKLLSSVSDTLGERVAGWWRRIRPAPTPPPADATEEAGATIRVASRFRGWLPAALGVLAAALISAFVDPAFGFDGASARTFASIAIGFAVDIVLGWFVLIWVVGRLHPQATAAFEFRPLTLLVVGATVVFTRVSGFEPGIVFGLVAGVAFGTAIATAAAKARLALITLGWALGIGLLAWIGYALLADAGDGLGILFLRETLAALTSAGIAALPLALLPVRGLTGHQLFGWNRWVWGGAYATGLLAFFLVLMPMPGSWAEVHVSLVAWIAMYAIYAAVALGLWLAVTRPWARVPADRAAS